MAMAMMDGLIELRRGGAAERQHMIRASVQITTKKIVVMSRNHLSRRYTWRRRNGKELRASGRRKVKVIRHTAGAGALILRETGVGVNKRR